MALKDVRIEFKVRNNLVLTKMEERGIYSISELCRQMKCPNSKISVGRLLAMKMPARGKRGAWSKLASGIADFFGCVPEDLFSDAQQWSSLQKHRVYAEIASAELQRLSSSQQGLLPDEVLDRKRLVSAAAEALRTLTPREERILRMRFGFSGDAMSLDEVGVVFRATPERIRQIEAKALRKLKHPSRSRALKAFIDA